MGNKERFPGAKYIQNGGICVATVTSQGCCNTTGIMMNEKVTIPSSTVRVIEVSSKPYAKGSSLVHHLFQVAHVTYDITSPFGGYSS